LELIAHLIGSLITPAIGRWFFRTVRRWPILFAVVALTGDWVGVSAVGWWAPGDWFLFAVGVLCLVFYTGLLALLVAKLWSGTWEEFCDWGIALFQSGNGPPRRLSEE
jgi:hypothetical protein